MRGPLIQLPLILTSLCGFAFSPTAQGWHGETALSPTISSVRYYGTGFAGTYYTASSTYPLTTPSQGDFTLLGVDIRQSVGWREWISFELNGSYSGALNGSANELRYYYDPDAMPAGLNLWDLGLETFTSVALDSTKRVYIEPAVGYAWVVANMSAATGELPRKNWVRTDVYGPSFALYMRLFLSDRVSLRFGSKYQASQLLTRSYSAATGIYTPGMLNAKRHSRARRHSLGALMRLDYAWRSWIGLHGALDYQSWSAGGAPSTAQLTTVPNKAVAPRLERVRFTWGVNFVY